MVCQHLCPWASLPSWASPPCFGLTAHTDECCSHGKGFVGPLFTAVNNGKLKSAFRRLLGFDLFWFWFFWFWFGFIFLMDNLCSYHMIFFVVVFVSIWLFPPLCFLLPLGGSHLLCDHACVQGMQSAQNEPRWWTPSFPGDFFFPALAVAAILHCSFSPEGRWDAASKAKVNVITWKSWKGAMFLRRVASSLLQ